MTIVSLVYTKAVQYLQIVFYNAKLTNLKFHVLQFFKNRKYVCI